MNKTDPKKIAASRAWQLRNPEKVKEMRRKYIESWKAKALYEKNKEKLGEKAYWYVQKKRMMVIDHYTKGERKCQQCWFDKVECLAVDHIKNNWSKHRKQGYRQYSLYKSIVDNNYPEEYQILCCNCNWLKNILNLRSKRYWQKRS